jgi:acyl-coenzyme A synthetase/AMP-(fatty) acid ligase
MVISRIFEHARTQPHRTALVWNGEAQSYASFAQDIEALRQALQRQSLPVGSTAVLLILNLRDSWVANLALRSLGLNTVSVMSLADGQALNLEQVSCVLMDQHKLKLNPGTDKVWPNTRLIMVPVSSAGQRPPDEAATAQQPAPVQGGHILYTSGTTGTYKKLFLNGEQDELRNESRAITYGLSTETRWHVADLGTWTAVGFKMPLSVWHAGGCVIFDQRTGWATHFLQQAMTHAMLVPAMVHHLLQSVGNSQAETTPGDFELIVTAGFMPASMAQAALARLTQKLTVIYGSTELSTPALKSEVSDASTLHWLQPSLGRTIEIVDEAHVPCRPGEEGQLRVLLTPLDYTAYLGDIEASAKVFRDGWFYPGDQAVARGDGRIRVLGRSIDVLNLQGRKIAVAPIEQAIAEKFSVGAVCLFSGVDSSGQVEVTAAVESRSPIDTAGLKIQISHLTGIKKVRIAVVKAFPVTSTGTQKINRLALRKLLFPNRSDQML